MKFDRQILGQVAVGMAGCASTLLASLHNLIQEAVVAQEAAAEQCGMSDDHMKSFFQSAAGFINASLSRCEL